MDMRHFFVLLFLNLSLFAYVENFNTYDDGTHSTDLNHSGITFSSKGRWEVFTTPFSIFTTPVLLEPSSSSDNSPLTLSFQETQCHFSLGFATDGKDTIDVIGLYRGQEVYHQEFSGSNEGGSYVSQFEIDTKLDAVKISTLDGSRLLIDNVETMPCSLDSYNISDEMLAHYAFEKNTTSSVGGIIGNAIRLDEPLKLSQEKAVKSIALWFNSASIEDTPTILQSISDDESIRMKVSINSDKLLQLDFDDAYFSPFFSDITMKSDTWTHLVLSRENENFNLYINGALHGSYMFSSKLHEENELFILGDNDFGMIDEVRLYNRSLSENEIIELYHTRKTFAESFTIGHKTGFELGHKTGFELGNQFCIDDPQACGLQAGSTTKDISIEKDIQALEGETFDIKWYLWSTGGSTYLVSGDSNNSSIWQLVPDTRQWKPVHNTGSFDGFEAQDALFDSITISDDGKQITFGNELNTSEEN